ncbi:MAG: hypothetical protein KatS3mg077_2315 [Candidatus Binatia bacterium]|nr:MAG: hypothetical protein KatS3mg077_2315 [Candidatus Binatia bacterium]
MTDDHLDYASAIQALREQRGLSRHDLALASGVSYSYLCEIERGTKRPSGDVLAKLANAFGMLPSELLRFVEQFPPRERASSRSESESARRDAFADTTAGVKPVKPVKPIKPLHLANEDRAGTFRAASAWGKPIEPLLAGHLPDMRDEEPLWLGKRGSSELVPHHWDSRPPGLELEELLHVAAGLDPDDLRLLIGIAERLARQRRKG